LGESIHWNAPILLCLPWSHVRARRN